MPGTRVRPSAGPGTSLVPGIPLRRARLCVLYRDGRDKPGHDDDSVELHMPDFIRHIVEGRMPVDLRSRRLEQRILVGWIGRRDR